ncbi:MAG: branched-chain amino acid aminotransferase [Peptococcaceae bacterium]|jgi:branched-chain amino acid aminotransferase|nr:branched-chain amino acid aminotransferase [Peptococcaceae bacterium]
MHIPVTYTKHPKEHPDESHLGFGQHFTDHMFLLNYSPAQGWHNPRIVPYGPLELDPATMTLHYAQEIFEGLKAYRGVDGKIRLFRAIENVRRLNRSNERLCVPRMNEDDVLEALVKLVNLETDWIPSNPDTTLYIRPFLIATDPFLGVRPSDTYLFIIILSPVGAYYPNGMSPTSMLVEDEDVRAVRGGLGFAKTGANYAATIRAQDKAKHKGFTQVLWLDALEQKYVEEIGTSNAFFKISGTVVTPPLNGSILPGITRMSVLELLRYWHAPVEERPVTITEIIDTARQRRLEESFASGTAAVISPIGSLTYKDETIQINQGEIGALAQKLYDTLTGIQYGKLPDPFGWTTII